MRAADVGEADHRDRHRPERRGGGDPEARQHAVGRDRRADLGDEGREVRGDEGELVAAGEEAEEDQHEGRVAHRPADDRRPCSRRRRAPAPAPGPGSAAGGRGRRGSGAAKTRKTWLHGITPSSDSARGGPDHLAGGAGGGGDAEAERAPLGRGGAADDGEDHPEAGAGDAEADQDVEELVRRRASPRPPRARGRRA